MILKCDYCGKEYKTYISPRCKNHFCSKKCSANYRQTKQIKQCANCGKEIYVRKSEIKVNNFCSNKCFNDWHGKNKKYEELEPRIKKRVDLDKSQDEYLKKCGYIVLRFWEDEIKNNEEEVYDNIKRAIQ